MVAEVGFEPTTTFWVVLAYGTRDLHRATLLRDKGVWSAGLDCTNEARKATVLRTACFAAHTPAEKLVEPRGVSAPILRVANALLYCLSYGPAHAVLVLPQPG